MISYDDALRRVLDGVETLPATEVALAMADGGVLAGAVRATALVPPFDASAMDGYAVRGADLQDLPCRLRVVTVSSAGHPAPRSIGPGEAARILTGAMAVQGADCVVRVEDTDGGPEVVEIRRPVDVGANIRRAGEGARPGDVLIASGVVLNPAHLGIAAGTGVDSLRCVTAPRVAVVATGDELVGPGAQLRPGQIHESNGIVVSRLAARMGCTVTSSRSADDVDALRSTLGDLAASNDVVITTGGVSMGGEYDSMRAAVAGEPVEFWKVAIAPAKPLAFGRLGGEGGAALFGLPGNPVAAVVAFELFVRPALRKLHGISPHSTPTRSGIAAGALAGRGDDRICFLRVRRDDRGHWVSTGPGGTHLLGGIAEAEALAVLRPGRPDVGPGDEVELLPLWV